MLAFSSILVGSKDPKKLKDFYAKVFDKNPDMDEEGYVGWLVGKTFFSIGPHDKVGDMAMEPARIILNFETDEVPKEFDRIKGLGASVVKEPYKMSEAWIATFEDPDGNYFQLMSPWKG